MAQTPSQARLEHRTDEGKTPAELGLGAQKEPMNKKKVESKKKDMATRMGKGMGYSMGDKNKYEEGPGQRPKMGTGRTTMERDGGMPYSMNADRKFKQERSGKEPRAGSMKE